MEKEDNDQTYRGTAFADTVEKGVTYAATGLVNNLEKWSKPQEGIHDDVLRFGGKVFSHKLTQNVLKIAGAAGEAGGYVGSNAAKFLGVDPRIGGAIGSVVADAALGFGAGKVAKTAKLGQLVSAATKGPLDDALKISRQANRVPLRQTLRQGTDNLRQLAMSPQRQLAIAGGGALKNVDNLSGLPNPAKPLQIASDMKPANWHGPIEALSKSPGGKSKIVERLSKPYHKDIKGSRFEYMSLEDLAADKGGWLTKLIGRSKQLDSDMAKYSKVVKEGASKSRISEAQRAMYDNFTFNPGSGTQQIYARTNPIRKAITGAFNKVAGKEWHHIFGNKEAAEAMLTKVSQDPYIAVNLLHHLKKLNLPTSGTPENIALMLKKLHRKKGGYHNWAKELGLEGRGKKANAVFDDYVKAISESVLDGTADAKEVFTIFESYAKLNSFLRKELKSKYGAQVISEMTPVMKYIQRGS